MKEKNKINLNEKISNDDGLKMLGFYLKLVDNFYKGKVNGNKKEFYLFGAFLPIYHLGIDVFSRETEDLDLELVNFKEFNLNEKNELNEMNIDLINNIRTIPPTFDVEASGDYIEMENIIVYIPTLIMWVIAKLIASREKDMDDLKRTKFFERIDIFHLINILYNYEGYLYYHDSLNSQPTILSRWNELDDFYSFNNKFSEMNDIVNNLVF